MAEITRRSFLKSATAFAGMPAIIPASVLGRNGKLPPSEKITVAGIGIGPRGREVLKSFLAREDVRFVAVADVQKERREIVRRIANRHYGDDGCATHRDMREVLGRADIDAVLIATGDHWHATASIYAARAGKDVYCEKPVTHLFAEGRAIVDAVASQKAVFQTGSQQRSDPLFQKVVNLVRNGVLGDVHTVEVGLPPGYEKPMGETAILTGRDGLDYDFWCGPAPKLPLMRARHHRWWRGHRAFGGGVLMDWIGHHNDIAHWAIGAERSGPTSIEVTEWSLPQTDVYNTPHHYTIACQYAGGIQSTISSRNQEGLKIMGTDGWIFVRRGQVKASNSKWLEDAFHPGTFRVPSVKSHVADFLECVRTRQECIAPAEIAHRSITPGHLGYVAAELGRKLQWNAATQVVPDDAAANKLLNQMAYRQPWTLSGEQDSA